MSSSQALAQSILGNLAVYGLLTCLAELKADDGESLLDRAQVSSENFSMEHKVDTLGERRPTSLDAYFAGDYRVAIECKLTEADVGACSHAHKGEGCDGNYSCKGVGRERCPLTERGVLYWRYVPSLFGWHSDSDYLPCPLDARYQLVRNVLAVGVDVNGTVSRESGHVVLLYDERNPAFRAGGRGLAAYEDTKEALLEPSMLRSCSWQRIVEKMRRKELLPWLTEHLAHKYGL